MVGTLDILKEAFRFGILAYFLVTQTLLQGFFLGMTTNQVLQPYNMQSNVDVNQFNSNFHESSMPHILQCLKGSKTGPQ